MAFETVDEATNLWIKGREFSIPRLLGEAYKSETERYMGGAVCIFRLAPQDYHRFHSPVDGVIGPMTYIAGEYYTVNVSHGLFGLPLTLIEQAFPFSRKLSERLSTSMARMQGRLCPLTAHSSVVLWRSVLAP
jgi:hypothetical protein